MTDSFVFGEALVLGLSSGPACLASCGPVLVPSLLAEQSGMRLGARYLSTFLGARFLGYLLFAAVAWELGVLVALPPAPRLLLIGIIHVLLAGVLLWYAYSLGHPHVHSCPVSELVTIGVERKRGISGPAALGFLTGLSLCPPFVIAGVRAAQLHSVAAAILFFALFFVGTTVWFLPLVSLGCVRRNEAVTTVARMAMVLIAVYYFFLGSAMLMGRNVYGH
ncbi:MAG TPA: sulfite exporter TauE/SafE family protein [Acidobacteriota bacterium]|nr:sulfite exporter TauE/SafE family protein [Acidobacteriota bacterium]